MSVGFVPLGALREDLPHACLLASAGFWPSLAPLARRNLTLTSRLIFMGAHVCLSISSFYKDTSHIGLEPTLIISNDLSIISIKTMSPNKATFWGLGFQRMTLLGAQFSP